ncbi:hypothetical protein WMY93_030950 [Mugilogobius chulae]|uniref:Uncharacterized protein n=1 Tax=Mugilogobius chulae TaxID=88201 RepID=A0AAW0MPS2_9GOBI
MAAAVATATDLGLSSACSNPLGVPVRTRVSATVLSAPSSDAAPGLLYPIEKPCTRTLYARIRGPLPDRSPSTFLQPPGSAQRRAVEEPEQAADMRPAAGREL